jgi:hypothetical protein
MSLYRADPKKLAAQAVLQGSPAGERVLRPAATTPIVADDAALNDKGLYLAESLDAFHDDPLPVRLSVALADGPKRDRVLRPEALRLLRYLGLGVRDVSGTSMLVLTSATRSVTAEERDTRGAFDAEAPPSTHTTGYAFDLSRNYRSPAQAQALQFWLDRLTALDVIAWVREPTVIHVTVGPRAGELS